MAPLMVAPERAVGSEELVKNEALHRYQIPKTRVPVRISLHGKPERSAFIFLGGCAEAHDGPERPSDLMNNDAAFFAIEGSAGTIEFLSRRAVAFLAVPIRTEIRQAKAQDHTAFQVAITLEDGRRLDGLITYQLPDSARRIQDFLNLPDHFLRLEQADEVLLVNKHRMISACLLAREGEPSGPD